MKQALTAAGILIFVSCFGQAKSTIYCFPGQGSDRRIFDSLSIDPSFQIKIIEYGTPEKGMTMQSFAKQLSGQIDTTTAFILLGVSLGGMICTELAEIIKPEKTIIIASAKNRTELPFRYTFQKTIPIYKLVPGVLLLFGAKILQPIVEPDRNKNKETFKSMIAGKSPTYLRRTVKLLMDWSRVSNSNKIYQIHGTNDHTVPFRKIKAPDYVIEKGSHMMTLTRGKNISESLNTILMH